MQFVRRLTAATLVVALSGLVAVVPAQRRRATPPPRASRRAVPPPSALTGLYRLDPASSDDPRVVAERAAASLVFGDRGRVVEELTSRLSSPSQLAIQRRGQTIDIASTRAPRVTFVADGREQTERAADGHTVRTRAVLYGDQLTVTSAGGADDEFSVNFDPVDGGRRLRVTRRIRSAELNQALVVQSHYDRISTVARFNIQGEPPPVAAAAPTAATAPSRAPAAPPAAAGRRQPSPPVITRREPPRPAPATTPDSLPVVPAGTRFAAMLDTDLGTERSREGDRFTMTVREPAQFEGATLEGYVSRVEPAGRVTGRSALALGFERIRFRDGRAAEFVGVIESVRAAGGEEVRVDVEGGGVEEGGGSQSDRTAQRVAIGAAVGAIIGAISGGGKGAAIGAAIGAGAGAGSVYVQGRDQLELPRGTEFTVRASARR